jgi:hypothetical protein
MRSIANKMVSGLACLAALLTPASGVPHFVCRCPDGHVKFFCLGITSAKAGCCCRGACCARPRGDERCCCRRNATRPARSAARAICCGTDRARPGDRRPSGGPSFAERPCCTRTLTAVESLAAVPKRGALDDVRSSWALPAVPASVSAPGPGCVFGVYSLAHSPGPPADLVTLLRRLVI